MKVTSHPEVRPLIMDPMNAESMALNALADGDRVHSESDREKMVAGKSRKEVILAIWA
jgi:gluconate kinase